MRFEASQHMRMGQHMKLAPRMIQSMEILQMPLAELQERIEQELENNPTLEIVEPGAQSDAAGPDPSLDGQRLDETPGSEADGFERLESFEEANPEAVENEFEERGPRETEYALDRRVRDSGEPDAKLEAMAATPARQASVAEQLRDQWSVVEVDEPLRPLGQYIIENLDADGYLRTPLEELASRAPASLRDASGSGPDPARLERALRAIQLFLEPAGVGARDARECLLLQLDAIEDGQTFAGEWDDDEDKAETIRAARLLASEYLDDLMNNRLPRIAERSGLTLDRIKAGLVLLRRLSLSPARSLAPSDAAPIVPDAFIEYDEDADRYYAYLNDARLPNLQVNREYARLTRDRSMPQRDREFIRTNMGNAQWLIDAVEQRKRTLLRVIEAVVDAQRDYFDYGPQSLRPLPMTQVADKLGIHVATVSRAVADKYVMTPRGVVPLRGFFTGGTQTETGEDVSWDAIKAALREVVDAEDKSKPLSDEALAEALKTRGLEIARRTVAKYREQLGIPTARLRKQF